MSREFLLSSGFIADPFEFTNADEEPSLAKYFVPPPYFASVFGDVERPKSAVVLAPRGGGKSAQRRMIELTADDEFKVLLVPYSDFSFVTKAGVIPIAVHLEEISRRVLLALLAHLDATPQDCALLDGADRAILRDKTQALLGGITQSQMESAIKSLRTPGEKMLAGAQKAGKPIRAVIAGVLSKATRTTIAPEDLELAPAQRPLADTWRETFRGLTEMSDRLGYPSTYVLVDKVDERPFTTQDSDAAFDLVRELVLDLDLLETRGVAFKFFLWDQVAENLSGSGFRRDRITQHTLRWSFDELQEMLRRRLSSYSEGRVTRLTELVCADADVDLDRLLPLLAQGSPRDMIRLGSRIVAEATREVANPECITERTIWAAVREFAQERAEELFPYVPELRKVGKPTFSMGELASDLLRVHENSARRKVQLWQATGLVSKVGEVQRGSRRSGRAQYLYGVTDPRLLMAMLPTVPVEEILANYTLICPACGQLVLDDRVELSCPHCNHDFDLGKAQSVLMNCAR